MTSPTETSFARLAARLADGDLGLDIPVADSMVGRIRSQFGHRGFVSVSDVAVAMNIACKTVLALREAGQIQGMKVGSGTKPYYRIYAPSVVAFVEKRSREA